MSAHTDVPPRTREDSLSPAGVHLGPQPMRPCSFSDPRPLHLDAVLSFSQGWVRGHFADTTASSRNRYVPFTKTVSDKAVDLRLSFLSQEAMAMGGRHVSSGRGSGPWQRTWSAFSPRACWILRQTLGWQLPSPRHHVLHVTCTP